MGDKSRIEWTDATWNPITGCTPISEGCANCYAKRMAETRLAGRMGYDKDEPFKVTLHGDKLFQPNHWGKPRRIFVCSMGDLFHEDVPDEWIHRVFNVMAVNARHTFLVLTKRPERMRSYLLGRIPHLKEAGRPISDIFNHVWLGVTAENQARADERIPILLDTPAAVRFVSVEPMLGPVDLTRITLKKSDHLDRGKPDLTFNALSGWYGGVEPEKTRLDWVICGGETGQNARPMHPDWARSLRDQCLAAKVPFFFKQWGDWFVPEDGARACRVCGCTENNACEGGCWWVEDDLCSSCVGREVPAGDRPVKFWKLGKRTSGRVLDDRAWDEYPEARP